MDVFYSRLIKHSGGISWYSDSIMPDLGGVKDDDYSRLIPSDFISNEIVNSGLYNKICVEVEIENLIFNTVMAFDELKNIDKEASVLNV